MSAALTAVALAAALITHPALPPIPTDADCASYDAVLIVELDTGATYCDG